MEPTKRKPRFQSTYRGVGRHGERVSGTPIQIAVLDLLQHYAALPSRCIRAALPFGSINDVLLLLHDNGFITVPSGATRHQNARARDTIYQLGNHGIALLRKRGRYIDRTPSNDQFPHAFLVSLAQFSFDMAAREISGLKKRTLADIKAEPRYPGGELPDNPKPDAPFFGYEFTQPSGHKRYVYLYGFEADRGTEPLTGNGRQTIEQKIEHYVSVLADRAYAKQLGVSNCSVPFITISETRAHNILKLIEQKGGEHANRFLVKWLPDFVNTTKLPPPTGHLVTDPWLTVDGTLNILDILNQERKSHDPRRKSSSPEAPHSHQRGDGG